MLRSSKLISEQPINMNRVTDVEEGETTVSKAEAPPARRPDIDVIRVGTVVVRTSLGPVSHPHLPCPDLPHVGHPPVPHNLGIHARHSLVRQELRLDARGRHCRGNLRLLHGHLAGRQRY